MDDNTTMVCQLDILARMSKKKKGSEAKELVTDREIKAQLARFPLYKWTNPDNRNDVEGTVDANHSWLWLCPLQRQA